MVTKCKQLNKGHFYNKVYDCGSYIKKTLPTALAINEYVGHRVYNLIKWGNTNKYNIEFNFKNSKATLNIEKYEAFKPVGIDVYSYPKILQSPSFLLVTNGKVDNDFRNYRISSTNSVQPSLVDNKKIEGYFDSYLISLLINDGDISNQMNFGLIDKTNEYEVVRFDFDDSFSYMYYNELPKIINVNTLNKESGYKMSSRLAEDFTPFAFNINQLNDLSSYLIQQVPEARNLVNNFPEVFDLAGFLYINLNKLPLEKSFINLFKIDLKEIVATIDESFKTLSTEIDFESLKKIYNLDSIKTILKSISKYKEKLYDEEHDIYNFNQVKTSKVVKEQCKASTNIKLNSSEDVFKAIAKIVKCITAYNYEQLYNYAMCFTITKDKYDNTNSSSELPKPKYDVECHNFYYLMHHDICNFNSIDEFDPYNECALNNNRKTICEISGNIFDICEPYHKDEL